MTQKGEQEENDDDTAWWRPIWEFFVHAVIGTSLFACITMPAIGLNVLIHYFETTLQLSSFIIYSMTFVEYAVLFCDLVLFTVFMWRSSVRTIRLL